MDILSWIRIGLFGLSAILPILGLRSLMRRALREQHELARADASTSGELSWGEGALILALLRERTKSGPREVIRDFLLIGGGVVAGAVAAIWSVLLEH
jgi:hypothetical protein